ncbi:hypothetical protein [Sporosarcina ureilytica]|uniref:Uncharacterized protein n=1 Tax=Sporosarcina ureilytica TaxID=298596 RepID=A0A1D8JBU2_9BACL|nr:hypothetical protein [Sporosarcina ureilytica]AOV06186.1 hypothetical protein BI350_00060 [Sporosarcina ureilytica]
MDTKSRNDYSVVWSIIAILIAVASIAYCFSAVIAVVENGWGRTTQMISYIARIIGGGIG